MVNVCHGRTQKLLNWCIGCDIVGSQNKLANKETGDMYSWLTRLITAREFGIRFLQVGLTKV